MQVKIGHSLSISMEVCGRCRVESYQQGRSLHVDVDSRRGISVSIKSASQNEFHLTQLLTQFFCIECKWQIAFLQMVLVQPKQGPTRQGRATSHVTTVAALVGLHATSAVARRLPVFSLHRGNRVVRSGS